MIPDLTDLDAPKLQREFNTEAARRENSEDLSRAVHDVDSALMMRVRAGDDRSFELLIQKHRGAVTYFVERMVRNHAVAEELVQEVFLRVYKARETYEPCAKFTTWLYRIATHLALNWIRDGRNQQSERSLNEKSCAISREVPDWRGTAEQQMLYSAKLQEVRRAIRRLPVKQRAAVVMHKYWEMEYARIARVIGCTESAVKSLLFRAYEALRAQLVHLV